MKAITPNEVFFFKKKHIPADVIQVVNELIQKNFSTISKSAEIKQCDIIADVVKLRLNDGVYDPDNETHRKIRSDIFENNELDFEDYYREAGWKVYYDKPAYYETYEPVFEFSMT